MNTLATIHWGYIALVVLATGILVASPFLLVLFRSARAIVYTSSDEFRLSNTGMWTEAHHSQDGGSFQLMRLKDGDFVLISVGISTVKVFVTPDRSDITRYREVKDVPLHSAVERLGQSAQQRHVEDLLLLERVRRAIAWPTSSRDLASALQSTNSSLLLHAAQSA